ncbi:hypothetical protein B0T20DRAFT_152837 [Sordaria brevicollis]|uniref:Ankyrin n=1 Tax=Sordaria brevicollis TaxID=83679 RepID=A0AAE0PJ11_SORBR|nr:hypothetical protein B0T20DRAFT_152837 [Sordaria brevicollis]
MAPPQLPELPTELIHIIASYLPRPCDLSALARTNQRLYCIINKILYTQAVKPGSDPQPLLWAARNGVPVTLDKAICAGAKANHPFEFVLSRKAWELVCILERAAAPNRNSDFEDWNWVPSPAYNPYENSGHRDLYDIMGTMRSNLPPYMSANQNPQNTIIDLVEHGHLDDDQDEDGSDDDPLWDDPISLNAGPPPGAGGLVGHFLGNLVQAVANNHNPFNDDEDEEDGVDPDDLTDEDSEVDEWVHNIRSRGITRRCAPIHIAAKEGHNAVIQKLLEHGADIHLAAEWYCSCRPPLSLWETRELEAAGTLRENLDSSYWPAVHLAMCFSRFDTAKFLIERGALKNIPKGHLRFTVLHQAASIGNLDMLKYIVEAGKDTWPTVDVEDDMGLTPLYFACAKGHWDTVVPYLIEKGADIDKEFEVDLWEFKATTTLLGEACYLGHYDRALKLIELGADVKHELEFNQLTFGRRHRLDEAEDEADEADEGIKKMPLLHVCCTAPRPKDDDHGYAATTRSTGLRLYKNEEPTALERVALIQKLLAAGTPIDQTWDGGNGETPLCMAARFHVTSAVRALLKAGANPHILDKNGRNPLMATLHHPLGEEGWTTFAECFPSSCRPDKAPEIVRLLLDAGVPVNHQDSQGRTALHLVFRPRRAYELGVAADALCNILRLLFDAGIDPCIRDNENNPVIKNALRWDYGRAADLLIQFHGPTIGSHLTPAEFRKYYLMMAEAETPNRYSSYIHGSSDSATSFELLLDVDRSHYLTSDKSLLFDLMKKGHQMPECFKAAERLAKRGLHRMNLTLDEKRRLIKLSIDNDLPRLLIEAVNAAVHTFEPSVLQEKSVLERALLDIIRHPRRLNFSEPMIAHLVNAGADLHRSSPYKLDNEESSTAPPTALMSPLYAAIRYGHVKVVKHMLSKQPIRGNAQARLTPYLHQAVNLDKAVRQKWPVRSQQDEATTRSDMVRALIEAGADPTLLNESLDTALSLLLKGLAADPDRKFLKPLGHLIKPLSRGVDINIKNDERRTAASYLEELMVLKEVDEEHRDAPPTSEPKMKVKKINDAVKTLRSRIELVPEEQPAEGKSKGEGRLMIKWLVPKGAAGNRMPPFPVPARVRERERYAYF